MPEAHRVVRAELVKIRTRRSVKWTLAAFLLPALALTWGLAEADGAALSQTPEGRLIVPIVTAVLLVQGAVAVVAVVGTAGEYTHGGIRGSLLMAPRRFQLAGAKFVAIAVVGFVVGVVVAVAASALTTGVLDDRVEAGWSLVRAVFGAGAYLAVLGVFATALALLIRNTAMSVPAVIGVVYVVPLVVLPLVPGLVDTVGELWPTLIGLSALAPPEAAEVAPWLGFTVFVAETALVVVPAVLVFDRRDA
ncbi:hypothetical protein GCM10022243_11620 [Saccharothrix violaceirubra]|uniref:ABC-type transport system involved in multi-copper enzyme maturation permease subunit n=1 Tax=Saccharothrix violaceirubra TaxID=413306 RepID=A0A7W7T8R9_9PSEU|nr:ABC transporter permease [Saccharothrix violaceirubra]MBB4968661.1 ABC-type transport system involved in multi-copper enzyme maturation permease subunit [Saccharothrix violaceirubra]